VVALPAAAEVAPHRALYAMTLDSTKPNSGVVGASGTLAYQWGEVCDGWTIEQRYKLTLQYEDEKPLEIGSSFVTWESKDGLRYRFNERKTRNGQLDDELHGTASLKGPDGAGHAVFDKPKSQSFDLPAGTLFPTAHTLMLIRKGEAGDNFVAAEVFDGSTLDGAVLTSAVIGRTIGLGQPVTDTDVKSALLRRPSWKVRLGFFPDSSKDEIPDYEMGMRLLDDGVSAGMSIDYGEYVILAKLQQIEALAKPAC
jgi:hypothetical protein